MWASAVWDQEMAVAVLGRDLGLLARDTYIAELVHTPHRKKVQIIRIWMHIIRWCCLRVTHRASCWRALALATTIFVMIAINQAQLADRQRALLGAEYFASHTSGLVSGTRF